MSREQARAEATKWIESLRLPPVDGVLVDLREPAKMVPFCGYFRQEIFRVASKQLRSQGASVIMPE